MRGEGWRRFDFRGGEGIKKGGWIEGEEKKGGGLRLEGDVGGR